MAQQIFLSCFWVVVVATFTTSLLHMVFIAHLRRLSEQLWQGLERPGPFYFLNGPWLLFGKYARYLLSLSAVRNAADTAMLATGAACTVSFYVLVIAWFVGVASWIAGLTAALIATYT